MRQLMRIGTVLLGVLVASTALAQESKFQEKMQEDLDYGKKLIERNCGLKGVSVKWAGGKLGHNPREGTPALSTLCQSGLEALFNRCLNNAAVKKAVTKVNALECTRGKGPLSFKLSGPKFSVAVDEAFTKDNAATQRDALMKKIEQELDQ